MASSDDLIPVRALNQVTYCQRLYYLEYVESVMPINEHVEDGLFQHRRVDDPDLAEPDPQGRRCPAHPQRSGQLRTPGHHRQARPGRGEERRGLPDRIQARLRTARATTASPLSGTTTPSRSAPRACCSKKNLGVTVPFGILYYIGSKTRVEVPFDDELRAKTLQAIRTIRELSERDAPPEPLPAELRHRCFGCSLAPICQPEETLFLPGPTHRQTDPRPRRRARRHHPRAAAERRWGRPLPAGAGLPRRQAQRAPGRPQGRRGNSARADRRRSARWSSSATSRCPPRPWNAWPRSKCRWCT